MSMQEDEAPVYAATKTRLASASATVQRTEIVQFMTNAIHDPSIPSMNFQDQLVYPPPIDLVRINLLERFHHCFTSLLDSQSFTWPMNELRAVEDQANAFDLEERMRSTLEECFTEKWDNFKVWSRKFVSKIKRRLTADISVDAELRHHHSDLLNKWDAFISGKEPFRKINWRIKVDDMIHLFKNLEEHWFNVFFAPPGIAEWILLPLPSVESAFRHCSMQPYSREINSWKHAFFSRQYENLSRIPTTVQHHMAKKSTGNFEERVLRMANLKRLSLTLRPSAKLCGATFYRRRSAPRGSELYLRYCRYDNEQDKKTRSANDSRFQRLPTNQQRYNRRQKDLDKYNTKRALYATQRMRRLRRISVQKATRLLASLAKQRNQEWRLLREEANFAGTAILFDI